MGNIATLIGEATEYDKKQEVERRKVKSWLKSVSAFANGSGGTLLFGVADDSSIAGLADAAADAEFVSQKIKERIDPVPQTRMTIERIEGKDVIALYVEHGDDTPYYYMGDGVLETFVRIGNESVVAGATDHRRLVLHGRGSSFDARPSDERLDDYAFSKLHARYYNWNGVSFDTRFYRSFGMVDNNGLLTNAGLLLADNCPLRQSRVFCTRWNGKTRGGDSIDALDSMEITGSIIGLIEDSLQFIKRNCKMMWRKEPTERTEIPEYPERSITEAIVNAIAHRDYLIQGSEVHIDIYDDRLTIYSPGAMPEGQFIQELDINHVPSIRRNPVVSDILAQLGYMERKGSGFGKIMSPYKAKPYAATELVPTLYSDRTQFTVTFPNMVEAWKAAHAGQTREWEEKTRTAPPQVKLTPKQSAILECLIVNPNLTIKEIADILGLTYKVVRNQLGILKRTNIISREGARKTGRWVVLVESGLKALNCR